MFKHPWEFDTFRRQFHVATGAYCTVTARWPWPDRSGWTVRATSGQHWAITDTMTPSSVAHPYAPGYGMAFTVQWGTAVFRVWKTKATRGFGPRPRNVRAYFPRAIVKPVDRRTRGPWGNELRLVQS